VCREIYIKRYILGISLIYKAKLERTLVGYLVETSVKGGRRQPVKLSNKGRKYLISSGLGIGLLYWRSYGLGHIRLRPCGSCNLYTVQLECYKGSVLI
jgi:hypothetical protein